MAECGVRIRVAAMPLRKRSRVALMLRVRRMGCLPVSLVQLWRSGGSLKIATAAGCADERCTNVDLVSHVIKKKSQLMMID